MSAPVTTVVVYTASCSCGWTHTTSTRPSAVQWKQWHRRQYQQPGQRLSETGHDVVISKDTQGDPQ